ncbi:zinc finger protein 710 [Elysia marginata]|uniref:Zinc finger protein 710 n=1 Tax=Elysia marginata TaxID=1093978 RepID=A0AAV4HLD1_9GAST|nr:zinc finger protein 710 [Elysia marginata]
MYQLAIVHEFKCTVYVCKLKYKFLSTLSVPDNGYETVASQAFSDALNTVQKTRFNPFAEASEDCPEIKQCPYCPETFMCERLLKKHLSECHGNMLPYQCKMCGKGCFSRQNLAFHMKGHEGRNYSCSVCGQKFTLKHHLTRHTVAKHGVFQCSNCMAVFKFSHDFQHHTSHCQKH